MSAEQRLAQIAEALQDIGLECLVMGGHAARYYGIDRNTADFDFCVGASTVDEVKAGVARSKLVGEEPPREGPSWRPEDFVRFELGRLPDGREEWLEFWLRNHLLPDFGELKSRQERGIYGDRELGFLSLPDLIRSKETERESDWLDVSLLEEILDARHLAQIQTREESLVFLSRMRSRKGFERATKLGYFQEEALVREAISGCEHPISFAFLLPFARDAQQPSSLRVTIDEAYLAPLRKAETGTSKHIALVEVVRRAYKRWAREVDHQDKESRRKSS